VSAAGARAALAKVEDDLAAAAWPWNGAVSQLVDALVVLIEEGDDRR
jgi:hypothetical protein